MSAPRQLFSQMGLTETQALGCLEAIRANQQRLEQAGEKPKTRMEHYIQLRFDGKVDLSIWEVEQ